jgi:hypothetical protein
MASGTSDSQLMTTGEEVMFMGLVASSLPDQCHILL